MAISSYNESMSIRPTNYQDRVFDETPLSNAGTTSSGVFRLAKLQSRLEFGLIANTAITVGASQSLTVTATWGANDDTGTWDAADTKTIVAYTDASPIAFAAGDVVALWTPETDIKHYVKIDITVTEDQTAAKVDGKIYYTA